MIIKAAVYNLIAENSNSSEQKHAGISHGEDCWIQTFEIDGARKQLSRPGVSVNYVVKPQSVRLNFTRHMIKSGHFNFFHAYDVIQDGAEKVHERRKTK